MAKIQTTWNKIKSGDIISFKYGSEDASVNKTRTVLVITPLLDSKNVNDKTVRLLHGIQLNSGNEPPILKGKFKTLIDKIGIVESFEIDNDEYYRIVIGDPQMAYKRIKKIIDKENIYKTYSYDKLKGVTVFLDSYNGFKELI